MEKDNLIENVRLLKDAVDVVQLLFFGKDYLADVMSREIVLRLKEIRAESGINYVVHLPIDYDLMNNAVSPGTVLSSIESIITATAEIDVVSYILHIDRCVDFKYPAVVLGNESRERLKFVLDCLRPSLPWDKLHIENTGYDFTYFSDILSAADCTICMDAGHLHRTGKTVSGFMDVFGPNVKTAHIHGFLGERDHKAVVDTDPRFQNDVLPFLKDFRGTAIIEVFDKDDFCNSCECLAKYF
ncbi:MAG: hypothetical protein HZC28_15200 [Spirochaetes bacterium]|nr:hypothetical protein [Spirochaetota bacterium]